VLASLGCWPLRAREDCRQILGLLLLLLSVCLPSSTCVRWDPASRTAKRSRRMTAQDPCCGAACFGTVRPVPASGGLLFASSHRNAKMHDVCSCLLLPTANQMWLWVWWRRGSENVSGDFSVLWVGDVATVTPSLSQCEAAGRSGGQRAARQAQLSFPLRKPKKKIVVWTWVERGVSRRASRAKHKIERRCGVGCRSVWVRQRGHEW